MNDSSPEQANLASSQRVLAALRQARTRLEAAERGRTEPIAVVGVGCRFPGSDGPQAFWELLRDGVDAVGEMPAERCKLHGRVDANGGSDARVVTPQGAFLDQVDQFDAEFFGISPREAISLDPQQRLLLEVSWEALEHAGQAPDRLAGSKTGVFVGVSQNDYALLQLQQRDPRNMDFYVGTGGGLCYGPGRVSHVLGLRGPNMAVDTACSSSLLSVHLACQSLRLGECDLALAGGVHLALSRHLWDLLAIGGALSPGGRCKAFDEAADGFGRGEGCGVVVLRRLSDALDRRDHILAVIRGSAVNHDGMSSGLTVPNETSQEELLRSALDASRIEPAAVDYVEAHGTGTSLGDPIEVEALASVFGAGRGREEPLLVGSVKSNFGHLEAAAGIAGLIKVALSLEHLQIPPHLHFHTPSSRIPWDQMPIAVAAETVPWQHSARPRIAGVSSFGMSGANAHVLLEEAPSALPSRPSGDSQRPHLLTLSARTPAALVQAAARFGEWLGGNPTVELADLAFTMNAGRAHFNVRTSVVAESVDAARKAMASISAGGVDPTITDTEGPAPKLAVLFTGQGSQYPQMGRRLYETQPDFRRIIDQCDELFRDLCDASLLDVLYPPDERSELIHQTLYTQPALFALECALAEMLRGWGIRPSAVTGHSIGEYVAAVVAGVFSLEDGFRLVAERARLMHDVTEKGAMAIVFADERKVQGAIEAHERDVSIAAINGPENIVISGRRFAVQTLIEGFEAEGIGTQSLNVSQAFHSPVIEPALAALEKFARGVAFSSPEIELISNATGSMATSEVAEPRYWSEHARQPVRFAEGMTALYEQGYRIFVECGPRPSLCSMARRCLPEDAVLLPFLSDRRDDWQQLLESVGWLYECGVAIDWEAFHRDEAPRRVAMPTYPFQRERFWFDADLVVSADSRRGESADRIGDSARILDEDCRYELVWRRRDLVPTSDGHRMRAGDRWLIFADRAGAADRLREVLEANGQECLMVYRGERFEHPTAQQWLVNPTHPDDFRRLLDECVGGVPLKTIVHLWSLDAAIADELNELSLDEAQGFGFAAALHTAQALARRASPAAMWLVTRLAVSLPSDSDPVAGLAQAPLWGLGKVIALEHPEVRGGMIDLPAELDDRSLAMLVDQVCAEDDEDHVAIRQGRRHVARIRRRRPGAATRGVQADATYLITGGIGSLGLRVARWFLDQGARHLVLTARRAPGAEAEATIREFEQRGAEILVARADVANEREMADVLQQIDATLPPLRGVIHAAGAFGYAPLDELDWEMSCQVLRPKVRGAWVLHRVTRDLKLDFFVCFSSLAALWGSKGQAHYAAANTFLDALAQWRRGTGLPATSVQWGPWSGGGMVTGEGLALLERSGLKAFEPQRALELLGCVLNSDVAQTGLADVDWGVFKALFEAKRRRPLLDEIQVHADMDDRAATPDAEQSEIEGRLRNLAPEKRRGEMLAWIQGEVASVLRLADGKLPAPNRGFFKLGMDSLMAVELARRLQIGVGHTLPATLAFDFPSVNEMAEHLAGEFLTGESQEGHDSATNAAADHRLQVINGTPPPSDGDVGPPVADIDRSLLERLVKLEAQIGET